MFKSEVPDLPEEDLPEEDFGRGTVIEFYLKLWATLGAVVSLIVSYNIWFESCL